MVFDKIRNLFTGSGRGDATGIYFYVQCARCGTPVKIRVDRHYDLRRDFEQGGYILHKEVMDGTCFQLFHFKVRFDEGYHIVEREIEGGAFITEDEYQALARPSTET
ncbi:MAG: hypothetical protein ACP5HM_01610 [Anaerolineae bacterium]